MFLLLLFLSFFIENAFGEQIVEEWYRNLHHYGPLRNDGWNARAMSVLDDYAFEIKSLDVSKNDQFMFVQKMTFINGTKPPPLGELNFKQGKIGVGELVRSTSVAGLWFAEGIPGGAGGRWPVTGNFTVRVFTPAHPTKSNRIEIELLDRGNESIVETSLVEMNFGSLLLNGDSMRSLRIRLTLQRAFDATTQFDAALLRNKTKISGDAQLVGDWVDVSNATAFAVECDLRINNNVDNELIVVTVESDAFLQTNNSSYYRNDWAQLSFLFTDHVQSGARWQALVTLMDAVSTFADAPLSTSWYVTPIHLNMLSDRHGKTQVLVSGFLRRDSEPCVTKID